MGYIIISQGYWYLNKNHVDPDLIALARTLSSFRESPWLYLVVFSATMISTFSCVISPRPWLRYFACFMIFLFFSLRFSFGKISHGNHIWIIASFLICFLSHQQPLISARNMFYLRLTQAILLSHYFIAGLWKVRKIGIELIFSPSNVGLEHMAHSIAGGHAISPFIFTVLAENTWLIFLGLFAIMVFQISALVPVFMNRFHHIWGYAAVVFHTFTGLFLGIWFSTTVLAALFFLIYLEYLLKDLKVSPEDSSSAA